MRPAPILLTFLLALCLAPASARANGRFPRAQMILAEPGSDGTNLVLRATFGLLLSHDGGRTWQWMCEQALGYDGMYDPPLALGRGGGLLVGLENGLRRVRGGCDVADVPELRGETVADLTVEERSGRALAVTSGAGKTAAIWREDDAGRWKKQGKGLAGFQLLTADVAPSRPARVYATGAHERGGPRAHLFRSDDGGATLVEIPSKLPQDGLLYVTTVDPANPDRLFVRQLVATGSDLLLSTDGGQSFRTVLHFAGAMTGFARSSDGATLWAGCSDPREGLARSSDRGETWEPMAKVPVLCLRADGPRLFVCSTPFAPGGFSVGVSTDGGRNVQALATFESVTGSVVCDGGTAGATCAERWSGVHDLLGQTEAARRAGIGAVDGGDADGSSGSSEGGRKGAPAPATETSLASTPRCGCGCTIGDSRRGSWGLGVLAVCVVAARRRTQRRRRRGT